MTYNNKFQLIAVELTFFLAIARKKDFTLEVALNTLMYFLHPTHILLTRPTRSNFPVVEFSCIQLNSNFYSSYNQQISSIIDIMCVCASKKGSNFLSNVHFW